MQKLIVVYNPRSSGYKKVETEVLAKLREVPGFVVAKYEVLPASVRENASKLAGLIQDEDLVVAAGGDGTAIMSMNAILESGKDATFAVLGYGNFNDMTQALGTPESIQKILENYQAGKTKQVHPLDIKLDGKHFRYAMCYATIGMAAEVTEVMETETARTKMQKKPRRAWAYFQMAKWYYKNRKKEFVPVGARVSGHTQEGLTDIIVMNAPRMARVMKGRDYTQDSQKYGAGAFDLRNSWKLFWFMMRSMFKAVPVTETEIFRVEIGANRPVVIQTEGEREEILAHEIEVRKGATVKVVG